MLATTETAYIHYKLGSYKGEINSDLKAEFEASDFAIALLMPKDEITSLVENFGGFKKAINDFQIRQQLSKHFEIPDIYLYIRLLDLSKEYKVDIETKEKVKTNLKLIK